MSKSQTERLGKDRDGDEVLEHGFVTCKGLTKEALAGRQVDTRYIFLVHEAAPRESMKETDSEEPITQLFPGLSKDDLHKKFESEFGSL